MPPRARKTAATAPPEAPPDGTEQPLEAPAEQAPEVPESEGAPEEAPETEGTPDSAPGPEWRTRDGEPQEPCEICFPGGPGEGAASVGCEHGTWVLAGEN